MESVADIFLNVAHFIISIILIITFCIAPLFFGVCIIKHYFEMIRYDFVESIGGILIGLLILAFGLYSNAFIINYFIHSK